MRTNDPTHGLRQGWEHLMGALDAVLEDARANVAMLKQPDDAVGALLSKAEQERGAAEDVFQELMSHRDALAETLDELQRTLAVAGLPLRGEIS